VKANLQVVACDVGVNSFDYDYERLVPMLRPDVLCVVSVHLFGIPSDTTRLAQLCRGTGIFVVEDAAQAFGGYAREGGQLGTIGDIGIFSFGRGKTVTCGSGGVILTDSAEITSALMAITRQLPTATPVHEVITLGTLLLLSWFIRPGLYWLPAGLPFLRLGETIFHEDFPVRWLSEFEARVLERWRDRLLALEAARRELSEFYFTHLDGLSDASPDIDAQPVRLARQIPLLRFPILLGDPADRRRLLFASQGRALGMSEMYPATVAAIPQLSGLLSETSLPRAEAVAARLVTLPTHPLVSREDRAQICALVNTCWRRGQEARMAS
jgi:dTDP-4-amino-4,6-dideoxygalactose transaminase